MHRGLKGTIITMVEITTEGIISTIIEDLLVDTMVETITTGHTLTLETMGNVFKMEVLKVLSLEMGVNKEVLGMVIPTTTMLYLQSVKFALEEGIQDQIVFIELIIVNHLVVSWSVKFVEKRT